MEDKNIELCQALELPVKYGAENIGGLYEKQHFINIFGQDNFNNKIIEYDDNEYDLKEFCVNLRKPNNFVQIMKIFHQEVNFSTGLSDNPVQSFLDVYLSVIQNNKDKDMVKRIKHFAQLVKWEY